MNGREAVKDRRYGVDQRSPVRIIQSLLARAGAGTRKAKERSEQKGLAHEPDRVNGSVASPGSP
jgi:hypothetical protein